MAPMPTAALIDYTDDIRIADLVARDAMTRIEWSASPESIRYIDPTFIELTGTSYRSNNVKTLVRDAVKHIMDMGFLSINEEDERIVDNLVRKRSAHLKIRPFHDKK